MHATEPESGATGWLRGWRFGAGLFAALFLLCLLLAWPTLRWPMVFDDLHVVRALSGAELLAAFHGPWDPDGIETGGLRPLSTLFNHLRGAALGENVLAHRLLVIGLFSLYLALLVPLARRVGRTSTRAAIAGALIALCSSKSVYHYVWLIDGVHSLQGLAFVGAGWLLLQGLARRSRLLPVLSGAVVIAGCLVREDTLVIVPVLVLLGLAGGERVPDPGRRLRLLAYAAGLGVAALALLGYRALMVPDAPPPSISASGVLARVVSMANPVGRDAFDDVSRVFSLGGWVIVAGLGAWLACARRTSAWRTPALWLACAVLACLANTEFQRGDLFLFAESFLGLACGTALDALARTVRLGGLVATGCLAWLLLGGSYTSRAIAENFHPDSVAAIRWNDMILYGYARRARVPEERRAAAASALARRGIHDRDELARRIPELQRAALAADHRRPTNDGQAFYPRVSPEGF